MTLGMGFSIFHCMAFLIRWCHSFLGLVLFLSSCLCSVHRNYLVLLFVVELVLSLGVVLSLSMLSRMSPCHSLFLFVFIS